MNAYPDYWALVTIGEGGEPSWVPEGSSGLHFFYSVPLRDAFFFLPSKLHQDFVADEIINPKDEGRLTDLGINKVIPVCDFDSGDIKRYGYEQRYNLNTDIDKDAYDCQSKTPVEENPPRSVELDITKYDFDIPGTFYIGVVTQISPAKLTDFRFVASDNQPQTEPPKTDPYYFDPSNIVDSSYTNTQFTVWMLVSTPCWLGDGGCDKLNPH